MFPYDLNYEMLAELGTFLTIVFAASIVLSVIIAVIVGFVAYLIIRTAVKNGIDRSEFAQYMRAMKQQEMKLRFGPPAQQDASSHADNSENR